MFEQISISTPSCELWKAKLDISSNLAGKLSQLLTQEENHRANRFTFPRDRLHFIAARAFLRQLLGSYLSKNASEIAFRYNSFGKPMLKKDSSLRFNLSHSAGLAVCGISNRGEIGVDIESLRPEVDVHLIAKHFFSPGEQKVLASLPPQNQTKAFFRCWTRKEAFIKARGDGLTLGLDQFEVSLDSDAYAELKATYFDPGEMKNWQMFAFRPEEGFVGAVVVHV